MSNCPCCITGEMKPYKNLKRHGSKCKQCGHVILNPNGYERMLQSGYLDKSEGILSAPDSYPTRRELEQLELNKTQKDEYNT